MCRGMSLCRNQYAAERITLMAWYNNLTLRLFLIVMSGMSFSFTKTIINWETYQRAFRILLRCSFPVHHPYQSLYSAALWWVYLSGAVEFKIAKSSLSVSFNPLHSDSMYCWTERLHRWFVVHQFLFCYLASKLACEWYIQCATALKEKLEKQYVQSIHSENSSSSNHIALSDPPHRLILQRPSCWN